MGGPQPGVGFVSVPLDVREFKKEMGHLLEDPLGVAERFDQFLGPNIYTWDEMESILKILFTNEERGMIRTAGMRYWDQRHQIGPNGDNKWPLQWPNWNNQDPAHRNNMVDLRDMIIQGIRDSVPRGQNINKAFNEQQKKDETPTEWLERLRKSLKLYSGLDPDSQVGQALLKTQFVAKSWIDIRKKLEKIEDWQERGLDELLREAQKVYVRREEENQKKQARILMAAVREGQNQARRRESPQRGPVEPRKQKGDSQNMECFYYHKKGHIQRNCRKRAQDERIFKED
uniref:Core shell protein Gag P30 domain-containing protein n=1 Tax=Calidris pygmaea TaxID=425635 RepID=A0A8C3KL39_9CHAR